MASIGDVFEIVDQQEMIGQQALNVYFYRVRTVSVTDNDASSVATAFIEQMLPVIVAAQTTDVVHTAVKVRNLFDETDAHTELLSEAGTYGDDSQSTFNAFPFQLVGNNAAVRPGAKRIAGVDGANVTDGVVDGLTLISALEDVAVQLAAEMAWGLLSAEFLEPVIVGRILDGGEYRLPTTALEAIISVITDALWNPRVTSQTSRKVGVGE